MFDQGRFALLNYLSRSIASDDNISMVELKPVKKSEYIRLPPNINEKWKNIII